MNKITFTPEAWEEYCSWQTEDRKILKRINLILQDIARNSFEGIRKTRAFKE